MHRPGPHRLRPVRASRTSPIGSRITSRYLDAFIAKAGIGSAYLVAQDWGTALAFVLAQRRPDFVRGLAFMEFIRPIATWQEFVRGSKAREIFRKFRTPGEGETLILEGNVFVERVLPGGMLRKLSDEEMAVYRAPFLTPRSRLPTWRFPKRTADRRRARRCRRHAREGACGARRLDHSEAPVRGRARRARVARLCGRVRRQAQGLQARQARRRRAFPPGRSSRGDRPGGRGLYRRG